MASLERDCATGTHHFFALASRIHWERRLLAGRPSRVRMSVTPTTRAAIVSRLEAGAPSRDDACFSDQREKVARTPARRVHLKIVERDLRRLRLKSQVTFHYFKVHPCATLCVHVGVFVW